MRELTTDLVRRWSYSVLLKETMRDLTTDLVRKWSYSV